MGTNNYKDMIGKKLFFRGINHHLVGRLEKVSGDKFYLKNASKIPILDIGRFMNNTLAGESLGRTHIDINEVSEFFTWHHKLPMENNIMENDITVNLFKEEKMGTNNGMIIEAGQLDISFKNNWKVRIVFGPETKIRQGDEYFPMIVNVFAPHRVEIIYKDVNAEEAVSILAKVKNY